MAIRTVVTLFPFNGLPKGHIFSYDTETDHRIVALLRGGLLSDITPEEPAVVDATPPTQMIFPVGIESLEEMGEIGGPDQVEPSDHRGDDGEADDAAGQDRVQGNKSTRSGVAKGR